MTTPKAVRARRASRHASFHTSARAEVQALESRWHLSVSYVVNMNVDGLRPDHITHLGPGQLPNLYKLRNQGSFTDNARSDFEFVHDHGLRTGSFVDVGKFNNYDLSWDGDTAPLEGGLPDTNPVGGDNGRDKIDVAPMISAGSGNITNAFVNAMQAQPIAFSVLHYTEVDFTGHRDGWMSPTNFNSVKSIDFQVGRILNLINNSPALRGKTALILSSEHGGTGFAHANITDPANFAVPLYVWAPGVVAAGGDLYAMNPTTRKEPGVTQPRHSEVPQPIRNGDIRSEEHTS